MKVTVTSVSKKEEDLFQSAAAVYVVTQEDFRRLGVNTLPEALRRVPGVEVSRFNSNIWSVTARGFSGIFSNKLLVLIDGRSVYNNLFGGVYWDVQDTALEDIDRIEVIRGPGGTLWGENAVNGVINIITKKTADTQGGLFTAGGGTWENGFTTLRYGGALGEQAFFRVFGKFFNRSAFPDAAGADKNDQWEQGRGGFRTDWQPTGQDALTLQGEYYRGQSSQTFQITRLTPPGNSLVNDDTGLSGGHLQLRWQREQSPESRLTFKSYFDQACRRDVTLHQDFYTWDAEIQHDLILPGGHDLSWGAYGRVIYDELGSTSTLQANPDHQTNHLAGFFLQDTFGLVPGRLKLVYGSKFGWNSFTGFEVQPNARLAWTPDDRHTLWGAVSRAVRIPNRFLDAVTGRLTAAPGPGGTTTVVAILPNRNQRAENLYAFELGFRQKIRSNVQWNLSFFYNLYTDLNTLETRPPQVQGGFPNPQLVLGSQQANLGRAEAFGAEWAADWKPLSWWTLKSTFTWFDLDIMPGPDSTDTTGERREGASPAVRFNISSQMDLPHHLELDTHLYVVDELTRAGIPAYARWDLRLGWRPIKPMELSVSVLNLADNRHPEFSDIAGGLMASQVPRSAFGRVTWRW